MSFPPLFDQSPGDVMPIADWEPDADFDVMPLGAKPKRTVRCPNPPLRPYLIGGHRYLFKHPTGRNAQQIWSEVIAYRIAREVGVEVPPAFIAYDQSTHAPGVLVEYFYGPPAKRDVRFVHAVDRFQAEGIALSQRRGALTSNLALSRLHGVPGWRAWWARTLAFDTLIGNTDRHSENWGFLVGWQAGNAPTYELGPVFDNGTSLGCTVRDEDLSRYLEPERCARFISSGAHHYDWRDPGDTPGGHANLCARLAARYGATAAAMLRIAEVSDSTIDRILAGCVAFSSFPVPFLERRADFVRAQVRARREALVRCLGG